MRVCAHTLVGEPSFSVWQDAELVIQPSQAERRGLARASSSSRSANLPLPDPKPQTPRLRVPRLSAPTLGIANGPGEHPSVPLQHRPRSLKQGVGIVGRRRRGLEACDEADHAAPEGQTQVVSTGASPGTPAPQAGALQDVTAKRALESLRA
jgi:hypothetical protein